MKFFTKHKINNSAKTRGALIVLATVLGNFFNFAYNAYLGRAISIEDFALISLLGSFLGLADIPINALGRSVTHKSAYFLGKNKAPAKSFWVFMRRRTIVIGGLITIAWAISAPLLTSYFKLEDMIPLIAVAPIWILSLLSSVDGGYVKGNLQFGFLAFVSIIEAFLRFAIVFALVQSGHRSLVYISLPIASFSTFLLVYLAAKHVKTPHEVKKKAEKQTFPFKFFATTALTKISATVYLTFDVILAKHFLSPEQAGKYALLALTGKIVYFAGSLFSQFILPLVSHKEGLGKNSNTIFWQLLFGTFISSLLAFIVVGAFGEFTMPLLFGKRAISILPLVMWYSGAMVAFTVATNIVAYHQIKNQHLLPAVSFILAILEIVLINLFHRDLQQIAYIMVFLGFLSLFVTLIFHVLSEKYWVITKNFRDLLDLFSREKMPKKKKGLRILIFNWRDTKHAWAGGAEVYIHEIARRFVKEGNQVTLFCGNDSLHKRNQTIHGVNIIRRGGFYTVYFWAAIYYVFKFRKNYDLIIDSENGIPFFTPLFSTKPIILLIHHVHQDVFANHMRFPFSYIGKFIEGKIMPVVYWNKRVVTVSESSKHEIIASKIASEKNIEIINPGVTNIKFKRGKTKHPSFAYLGRLKAYKNVDVAIKAFSQISKKYTDSEFYVIGEGECLIDLKSLAKKLGIENKITFYGKVSEGKKTELLAKSWAATQPSDVEGWGITVIEANSCKTPVIASNVNGLKDSIINRKTGILVEPKNVKAFEAAMHELIKRKKYRLFLSKNAYNWSREFRWEISSERFSSLMLAEINSSKSRRVLPNISLPLFNRN